MAKRFFETFPALILEDELKDLFEFAEVTALKYNRDRTAIHVYLLCRRLISKPQIYAVESKIEKQMFPDGDMRFVYLNLFHCRNNTHRLILLMFIRTVYLPKLSAEAIWIIIF